MIFLILLNTLFYFHALVDAKTIFILDLQLYVNACKAVLNYH